MCAEVADNSQYRPLPQRPERRPKVKAEASGDSGQAVQRHGEALRAFACDASLRWHDGYFKVGLYEITGEKQGNPALSARNGEQGGNGACRQDEGAVALQQQAVALFP